MAMSLPAAGTLTLIVAVLPFTLCLTTVIAGLQLLTESGVEAWISAPFCATNAVGSASFWPQKLPLSRRAGSPPTPRAVLREVQFEGSDRDVGNGLQRRARDPGFMMNVVPTRSTVTP